MTSDPSNDTSKDTTRAIVDALLTLAAERDWRAIDMSDIAQTAAVPLSTVRERFPSKGAILGTFAKQIDLEVLRGFEAEQDASAVFQSDEEVTPRDKLFDLYMRRLTALAPYRAALQRIKPAIMTDPLLMAGLNGVALNTQRFMLAAAGIRVEGVGHHLALQGAVVLFTRVLNVWLSDETPTHSLTMSTLDKELLRAEKIWLFKDKACARMEPITAMAMSAFDALRDFKFKRPQKSDFTADSAA
jgi:AcrR family transcriptional regulator